jgi:predicted DNA repair protein MutK
MGYVTGLLKYIIKTPLTVVGFVSMYIFGGGILSVVDGLSHLLTEQSVFEAILVYFISEYLPPTSLEEIILQTAVGTVVAGILWFWKTAL